MKERTYHIITFGCQMNVHDSQWLGRALEARGFAAAPLEEAQVVVVNTCSVREKPELKVMSTLGRIRQATGNSPRVLVGVTGCVAQQLGDALFRQRQVRLVAGSDGISGAPAAIERLLDDPALRLAGVEPDACGLQVRLHLRTGHRSEHAGRGCELSGPVSAEGEHQRRVVGEDYPERRLGEVVLAGGGGSLELAQEEHDVPVPDVGVPELVAGGLGYALVVQDHLRGQVVGVDAGEADRAELFADEVGRQLAYVPYSGEPLDENGAP